MRSAAFSLGPDATYTYHDNLQMADTTFGNGLVGANLRGTNGMVRPARRVVGVDENNILWDSGVYAFDEAGNIKSIGTDSYTYDAANRLRSATVKQAGANRSESYQYNTTDSMTQITNDQFGTRNFNVSTVTNRLLGIGATANDWTYDGAGNTLSANGGAFTFTWEPVNMLTRYREGSKDFVSIYGPGDYRVWIEDRSTGTKYWTSRGPSGQILREYEVTGNGGTWKHTRDYIRGAEGILAAMDHDGTEIYYHTDHLGTPRLKTTSSGSPFSYHHYYPYGLDANFARIFEDGFETGDLLGWEKDKDVLSVKYTGHQRERRGNLDYMLGRHYSFITNRFVSADPARDGWNLYTYVGDSPVGRIDRDGRAAATFSDEITVTDESARILDLFIATARTVVTESKPPRRRRGWKDTQIGMLLCPRIAEGISADISTINPFTSGGGGAYGINLQFVPGEGLGVYSFATPNSEGSVGFDLGVSLTANFAVGSGEWSGDFLTAAGSFLYGTAGGFATPSSQFPGLNQPGYGRYGVQAGGTVGAPVGAGATITNYNRFADLSFMMPWCKQ